MQVLINENKGSSDHSDLYHHFEDYRRLPDATGLGLGGLFLKALANPYTNLDLTTGTRRSSDYHACTAFIMGLCSIPVSLVLMMYWIE